MADGVTGFLVDNAEQMASTLSGIASIKPEDCRLYAQRNYSARTMADAYEELYRKLLRVEVSRSAAW